MREPKRADAPSPVPWALLAVAAAVVFVAFLRLRVADIPLERDEGEYAYAGQLILEGVPPYAVAYNMKFPGTYYAYAAMLALFGRTPWGIHFGLLLVNAATIGLVFLVGRKLIGEFAGAVAAIGYALLSVDRWVLGIFAHATHFAVVAAMAGLYLLLVAVEDGRRWKFVASGALFGLSVLMKQHAIFFLPLAAVLAVPEGGGGLGARVRAAWGRVVLIAAGSMVPPLLVFAVLAAQGVLGRFWFWTFRYASAYVTEIPIASALSSLKEGFLYASTANLAFWILAAGGLIALWIGGAARSVKVALTGLLAASFLAICPGFYFRAHYFILMLPAVALLGGFAVESLRGALGRAMPRGVASGAAVALFAVVAGWSVFAESAVLFTMSPRALSREIDGSSPFIEAVEIAKYVREHTQAGDTIAVLGSEPEIYFYADRKAATGHIYTYALMEPQPYAKTMQAEMIAEIESAHPKYLVYSWIRDSWLPQPGSDQGIMQWGRRYVRECYEPVGVADIVSENETRMVWDGDVRGYVAASENLVYTFRRKSDTPCVAK